MNPATVPNRGEPPRRFRGLVSTVANPATVCLFTAANVDDTTTV